jgi:hypothetical protein
MTVLFAGNMFPTSISVAVGADLLAQGVCSSAINLVDTFVTYTRFRLVCGQLEFMPKQDAVVCVYVFVFVICTSLPFYTIVPMFLNLTEWYGLNILNICLYYVYVPGICVFNIVFGLLFMGRLWGFSGVGFGKQEQHPKIMELAYNGMIHSVVRSVICPCTTMRITFRHWNFVSCHFVAL